MITKFKLLLIVAFSFVVMNAFAVQSACQQLIHSQASQWNGAAFGSASHFYIFPDDVESDYIDHGMIEYYCDYGAYCRFASGFIGKCVSNGNIATAKLNLYQGGYISIRYDAANSSQLVIYGNVGGPTGFKDLPKTVYTAG